MFSESLYERVAAAPISVPPLRERLEDLPLIIQQLSSEMGIDPAPFLTVEALEKLGRHAWPDNLGELRELLESTGVAVDRSTVAVASHSGVGLGTPLPIGKREVVERYERAYLTAMLDACKGNLSEAARRAGMERVSLYRMMQRLGLRELP